MSFSGASTGIVNLGANTLTITNANGTFAGVIQDGGAGGGLAITGGKEILTGANTYTGSTVVTGATLELDGSINGTSSVTVNSGGTLSGVGLVDPPTTTINSGGTLSPGNAANPLGTLTIAGTLNFNAGSFYAVQIAQGAGNNSKTVVTGTANLGGNGTVVVTPQLGHYATVYQILTPTALSGTFAGLIVNGSFVGSIALDYTTNPGKVDLDVTGVSLLPTPPGANGGQQNVVTAINNGIIAGPLPAQFQVLSGYSNTQLLNALSQLNGEAATGGEHAAFQLMDEFLALMLDPFVDGRLGGGVSTAGGQAIGFAPDQQASLPPDIALAYAAVLKAPPKPTFDQRWTAWGASYGGSSTTNGNARRRHQQPHRTDFRLCRRHGLSPVARHDLRLCAWRRRHQLGSRQRARHRAERCVPGRRLWRDALGTGLSGGRIGVRQSLVHDQSLGAGRCVDRELLWPELRRAVGRRLSLCSCCRHSA